MSADPIAKAREKVEKEFVDVQKDIAKVHSAFHDVKNAGPYDDLYGLLDVLADSAKKARSGGAFGSGAKSHRKALAEYEELTQSPPADSAT